MEATPTAPPRRRHFLTPKGEEGLMAKLRQNCPSFIHHGNFSAATVAPELHHAGGRGRKQDYRSTVLAVAADPSRRFYFEEQTT